MKIAIIPQPGFIHRNASGYNKRMFYLVRGLKKRGHDVKIFVADPRSETDGQTICLPLISRAFECRLNFISEAIKLAQDCDIINCQTDHLATIFNCWSNVPIIHTLITSSLPPQAQDLLEQNKDMNYSAVSKAVVKSFSKINFLKTIYNGCDTKRFAFNKKPNDYFFYLSRIDNQKAVHKAIEAVQKTGDKLIIAGKILDENYFNEKVKPHLNKKIQYIGELNFKDYDKKIKYLQKAKGLFSLSEYDEGFSNTILEALSCGTPVIASNLPSYREIIKNGYNGFVAKNLKEAILACSNINTISRANCRKTVEQNYTYDQMVDGYEKIFKKIKSEKYENSYSAR